MADLKTYDIFDVSQLTEFIRREGRPYSYSKGECFIHNGNRVTKIGVVKRGAFAFSRSDYKGNTQIFSVALAGDLAAALITSPEGRSVFDITALCQTEVLVIDTQSLSEHMKASMPYDTREKLFYAIAYGLLMRAASQRCESPETRYNELLDRCPDLDISMSKTAIASYLGITREHFARLRAKMRK